MTDIQYSVEECFLAMTKMIEGRVHRDPRTLNSCANVFRAEIKRLKTLVMEIETRCDPAGETSSRIFAEDAAKALQVRAEGLKTVNGALRDAASNNLARVQELGKDNESLLGKIVFLREGAEKREARVKELEKERDRLAGRNVELEAACLGYDGLHISEKQIDAAVEVTKRPGRSGAVQEAMWMVLNRLDIFRCKGCGGEGKNYDPSGQTDDFFCNCCGGHGWVIKEPK